MLIAIPLKTVHDLLVILGKTPIEIQEGVLYRIASGLYLMKISHIEALSKWDGRHWLLQISQERENGE